MTAIKLKSGELALLRSIAHSPKTAHSVTHVDSVADVSLAPHVVRAYLDHMSELVLITAPVRQNGYYCVTEDGLAFLAALPALVPSTLITNASMPSGSHRPKAWPPASERGERNKLIPSRGMG